MNILTNLLAGLPLGLVLTTLPVLLILALAYRKQSRHLENQRQGIVALHREHKRSSEADQSLRKVIRRHLKQSLQMKADLDKLCGRVRSLDFQVAQRSDFGQAIDLVRKGQSLEPLLERGQINSAEAHLLKLVHHKSQSI